MKWILNHLQFVTITSFLIVVLYLIQRSNKRNLESKKKLQKAIASNLNEPLTLHPEVDPTLCMGCGACTKVCPEGDILQLLNSKAHLVAPTKCVGHGECEQACPTSAISLVFGTKTRGMDIPRISTSYETNVSGLYIAGELGGMGLIRNAFKQGIGAVEHAARNLQKTTVKTDCDVFIVGAGPAGLAASVSAISQGLKYICIEQNSFGGTIANFPRQKVVMTHPSVLPLVGELKFNSNKISKEALLSTWMKIKSKLNIQIQEQVSFKNFKKESNVFYIETSAGIYTSQKLILAMGVRGSPRRLGLPNEDLAKVTYNLIDPEQYQNCKICVVGGGNAGVEAAQMLSKSRYKNDVILTVRGSTFDRCNEENQNIIFDMERKGLVKIWYDTKVTEIHEKHLVVQKQSEAIKIANDFLFIFAGAEMPHKMLMDLGIKIDKKFGERRAS